ncbi:putative carboxypeptidase precursor [Staphylotrichum tortipilum]|uniref:Carboxypeptidase n=1 Tax=Staphylotrichum tortipilum TaxID=2831512 RepID=A0AAN6MCQ7_9PEZI|nr:putative carboxypeptidase precursor [Staphylotrichum longicolle]
MKFTAAAALLVAPLAVLASAVPKVERKITYDGYKAYRIATHNNAKSVTDKLAPLAVVPFNQNTRDHVDVVIPPSEIAAFEALGFEAEVLHEDLGADIREEANSFAPYQEISAQAIPSDTWFDAYHAYADHITFFNDLQAAFPTYSEILNIGASVQGRQLFGIHIWGSGGKGSKPAIYFHGTVHAREWISSKVVEYLAYNFLTQYNDTAVKAIRDNYDIYILPFVNPDGFVYTQTSNRLWRKNRQTRSSSSCVGTDINRNWPYKWELSGGASTDPCDETYKGLAAGDTPENRALVSFTQSLSASKGIKLYIDWHSYGQYILIPYGYDCSKRATNHAKQLSLAQSTASKIAQSYGTKFTYGPSCSTLYATTGDSVDYMQDVAKAEYSWTIELRPTGSGGGGFVLPASQIRPSGVEQWEGIKYLLASV